MEINADTKDLLLVISSGKSRYAVAAENVQEIIASPDITALPRQPEYLRGIISYKGDIIPVLSLRTLCGSNTEGGEAVCVILRTDDFSMALAADGARSLVNDSGQRMHADDSLLDGGLLKLDFVMPGDSAILVIDLQGTYHAAEKNFNSMDFGPDRIS
jgi:Chemotaxis signal transduction protein